MKQLAIPLGCQKTTTEWLVMPSKLDVELTQRSVIRHEAHTAEGATLFRPT